MFNLFFDKDKILFYFALILLLEVLSFFSWQFTILRTIFFIVIVSLTIYLTWKNLNYGLLLSAGELIIGSFGYLFNIDLFGLTISWRMLIWLIIMFFWTGRKILQPQLFIIFYKNNKPIILAFFVFFFFLFLSIVQGLWSNIKPDVLWDANAWFYLALLLPWLDFNKKYFNELWQILIAAVIWLFIKTAGLLYLFSHNFSNLNVNLYDWMRDYRIGEITFAGGNFWRVFIQSQSFALFLSLTIIYLLWLFYKKNYFKQHIYSYVVLSLALSVVLMSYSRSFWLGLAGAGFIFIVYTIVNKPMLKLWVKFSSKLFISFIISVVTIILIVKFPWPPIEANQQILFINRLKNPTQEAAGSARINQLKPLFTSILSSPLVGHGFGTKLTYQSTDPRIVAKGEDFAANYSTYSFEWGYLDMLVKFGVFGLFAYFYLLWLIYRRAWLNDKELAVAFLFGFMAILITNITTPYLNHPLGMGLIFWLVATGNKLSTNNNHVTT